MMNTFYHDAPAAWGREQNNDVSLDGGLAYWSKRLLAENAEMLSDLGKLSPSAAGGKNASKNEPLFLLDESDDISGPESDLSI